MLIKNQCYEATVCDYTAEGQGIAKIEGCTVFVPNAIVGEVCTVRIEKVGKTWASGKIDRLLTKSPHRINRDCPVAKQCGGCDFRHMDYAEELRLKADRVRQALCRLGGEAVDSVPIAAAPTDRAYRNKAQYPVSADGSRVYAGFFRAGTHQVVENTRCQILPEETDAVKDAVIRHANRFGISAYDEATGKGLLRHIYVRRGAVSRQLLVCLVINGRALPHGAELIGELKKIPGFTTLVLSVNTRRGNGILGQEFIPLDGDGTITDTLCGLEFRLSPRTFYQVNHDQAERLYAMAIEQAQITKTDLVLDLYCGAGTITLAMARAAGKVIGVEIEPQAVADARDNARRNGIENAEFLCADAGSAAQTLADSGVTPDVITVDPPRKGLSADAIDAIAKMAPPRVVYISCDPATLARDVALLKQHGYRFESARACDLFPRCAHVETVVLLSQQRPNDKIRVELDLTDFDITAAEKEATYQEIKDYVLEHSGLKVSSLYIAQVKQKCGIIERENYNKPKSEDAKQPQCPPDKEKAIKEALKHFGMI